jgi:hypothetical protein
LDYGVETREVPATIALAVLVPVMKDGSEAPIVTGSLRALAWKRPQDQWSTVRYKPPRRWSMRATLIGEIIEIAPPVEIPVPVDAPVFTADHKLAVQELEEPFGGAPHLCIWDAVVETSNLCGGLGSAETVSHVVVYSPFDAGKPSPDHLERVANLAPGMRVHGVSQTANPFLEDLCKRSGGGFHLAAGDAEVAKALEQLYVRLSARYTVTYRASAHAAGSIQVHTPEGWAEVAI